MIEYFNRSSQKIACWINPSKFGDYQRSLIFVHGAGSDHRGWSHQYSKLHKNFNIAAVDLPGHGQSSGAGETAVADYAHHVRKLLVELQLPLPIVVGHSMGAAIALQLAIQYPEEIAAIVPVGGGMTLPVNPLIFDGLKLDAAETKKLICKFSIAKENREKLLAPLQTSLAGADVEVLHRDFTAYAKFDLTAKIKTINIPTFVVCGSIDKMTPPDASRNLQKKIKGSRLCFIEGAGHMPMLEKPEIFNEQLLQFIESLSVNAPRNKSRE